MSENERNAQQHDDELQRVPEEGSYEEDVVEAETRIEAKLKQLRDKLKRCEAEKMDHLEELQRVKADFLNSKRRLEEELRRKVAQAENDAVLQLLPLYDSFQMAMQDVEAWNTTDENWREGIKRIYTQLETIFKHYGVTVIDESNVPFNPEYHEAIDNVTVTDAKKHETVAEVVQAGFIRTTEAGDELLIRPARVKVAVEA